MCVLGGGHYHKNNFSKRWFHIYSSYFQEILNIEVCISGIWEQTIELNRYIYTFLFRVNWHQFFGPSNRRPIFSFSNWRQVYGHMQRSKRRDMLHYIWKCSKQMNNTANWNWKDLYMLYQLKLRLSERDIKTVLGQYIHNNQKL